MRKMQRPGCYLATSNIGGSQVITNLPEYLIAAVRDGIEVTGELK